MDKKRRQAAIIEIITENEVETQGELSKTPAQVFAEALTYSRVKRAREKACLSAA